MINPIFELIDLHLNSLSTRGSIRFLEAALSNEEVQTSFEEMFLDELKSRLDIIKATETPAEKLAWEESEQNPDNHME